MEEKGVWIGAAVATLVLGAAVYYLYVRDDAPPPPPPAAHTPAAAPADAPPPIQNPLPAAEGDMAATPLPSLSESDPAARDAVSQLFGGDAVGDHVVPDRLVRRFVITVDNLARRKAPVESRPLGATPGSFRVTGTEDAPVLDPQNYARYEPVVALLDKADASDIARVYLRFYPLLQEAYADLGREGAYFNDRVVEVVDHLLATPDVQGPVALVRPRVYYEYADPQLESLSSGQKLLIRMGPENAAVVKGKLRQLRQEIAAKRRE